MGLLFRIVVVGLPVAGRQVMTVGDLPDWEPIIGIVRMLGGFLASRSSRLQSGKRFKPHHHPRGIPWSGCAPDHHPFSAKNLETNMSFICIF